MLKKGESVFTIASSVDGELTERALALHPSPSREELITAINFSIRGNAPTFQMLLEKGRDLFSQDDVLLFSFCAFHFSLSALPQLYNFLKMAFSYGRVDVLEHLRKEGLEMTHTFFRNQNLLYFLTNSAPSILPRMIDEALEAGLDLNFKSEVSLSLSLYSPYFPYVHAITPKLLPLSSVRLQPRHTRRRPESVESRSGTHRPRLRRGHYVRCLSFLCICKGCGLLFCSLRLCSEILGNAPLLRSSEQNVRRLQAARGEWRRLLHQDQGLSLSFS